MQLGVVLSWSKFELHQKKTKPNQNQPNKQKTPENKNSNKTNFFFFWKCSTHIIVSTFLIFAPRYLPSFLESKSAFCSFWNLQIVGICHVLNSPPPLNCHAGKENILKDASVQVNFKTTSKPTVMKMENTFLCKRKPAS